MKSIEPAGGALERRPPAESQPGERFWKEARSQNRGELSQAALSFYEKISAVSSLRDFLIFLSRQMPKKLKAGELILFYVSPQFGLRRAYLRKGIFYEEIVKTPWPALSGLQYADQALSLYAAREMGRPFPGLLAAPFPEADPGISAETIRPPFGKSLSPALLAEIRDMRREQTRCELKEFFRQRLFAMSLILRRSLLSADFSRTSYLWGQIFGKWDEPLAILQRGQKILANKAFERLLPLCPDLPGKEGAGEKPGGQLAAGGKIYRRRAYPISPLPEKARPRKMEEAVFLYLQNMTGIFRLRELLLQSEKMAALARLGRNMSHQLSGPLESVRREAQSLRQNPEFQQMSEDLKDVEEAAERAQKIIKSFLAFSQKSWQPETHAFDLNQAVRGALPLLQAVTFGIQVKLKLSSEPLMARADFALFQQVVYNLILNACQALREKAARQNSEAPEEAAARRRGPKSGGAAEPPVIEIFTERLAGGQALMRIRDNGPGIPESDWEKIFQPLWTTKKPGEGTGLGLGFARRFVERAGGKISVQSRLNQFSCFEVEFPLL